MKTLIKLSILYVYPVLILFKLFGIINTWIWFFIPPLLLMLLGVFGLMMFVGVYLFIELLKLYEK